MVRIVFPTNQKLSYISKVESNFEESDFLTVLDVLGQNITGVEIIRNPHLHTSEEIIQECKDNKFGVIILPESSEKSTFEKLKNSGISIYTADETKTVLNTFSDFVQDKLVKVG